VVGSRRRAAVTLQTALQWAASRARQVGARARWRTRVQALPGGPGEQGVERGV
jgi:hypothetical protein